MIKDSATRSGLIGITTVSLLLIAIGILSVMSSCGSDSTEKADKANDKRIEAQAVAMSDDAKDDAKKMAEKMVDLASMQLTARKLSEEGMRRAANPQVKMYAQRVLTANQQADNELRQLATALSFQLPTALNDPVKQYGAKLRKAQENAADEIKQLKNVIN